MARNDQMLTNSELLEIRDLVVNLEHRNAAQAKALITMEETLKDALGKIAALDKISANLGLIPPAFFSVPQFDPSDPARHNMSQSVAGNAIVRVADGSFTEIGLLNGETVKTEVPYADVMRLIQGGGR